MDENALDGSSDDYSVAGTPPELLEAAHNATAELLPKKSRERYQLTYNQFSSWCEHKNARNPSENVLIAYFAEKAKVLKPTSLWTHYSMLKSTMLVKKNIDISKYCKLIAFLKRKNDGYKPNKSKVLSRDQFYEFLKKADDNMFLMMKVALIFGIAGACRRVELTNLELDDIEDMQNLLLINIRDTKTKINRKFTVTAGNSNGGINFIDIYRKYASLRPKHTKHRRFFLFYKSGKCSTQVVGINTMGQIPLKIAEYLKLENPRQYTGHCFRRSSATLLADTGADICKLKRHGGWKSSTVAEGYVEDSVQNKIKISKQILDGEQNFQVNKHLSNEQRLDVTLKEPVIVKDPKSLDEQESLTMQVNNCTTIFDGDQNHRQNLCGAQNIVGGDYHSKHLAPVIIDTKSSTQQGLSINNCHNCVINIYKT